MLCRLHPTIGNLASIVIHWPIAVSEFDCGFRVHIYEFQFIFLKPGTVGDSGPRISTAITTQFVEGRASSEEDPEFHRA